MSEYELAQLNVAQMRAPLASPGMAGFTGNLERINALADAAPGFVWRLQTEDGDATALRPFGDDVLVNVSVWRDVASLHVNPGRSASDPTACYSRTRFRAAECLSAFADNIHFAPSTPAIPKLRRENPAGSGTAAGTGNRFTPTVASPRAEGPPLSDDARNWIFPRMV